MINFGLIDKLGAKFTLNFYSSIKQTDYSLGDEYNYHS